MLGHKIEWSFQKEAISLGQKLVKNFLKHFTKTITGQPKMMQILSILSTLL